MGDSFHDKVWGLVLPDFIYVYSGTLIIGPLLGRAKIGQINKVVTLSRWSGHILWPSGDKSYDD